MKNKYMLILEIVVQVLKVWLIIFHKFLYNFLKIKLYGPFLWMGFN